jgi:hypothetical protein
MVIRNIAVSLICADESAQPRTAMSEETIVESSGANATHGFASLERGQALCRQQAPERQVLAQVERPKDCEAVLGWSASRR